MAGGGGAGGPYKGEKRTRTCSRGLGLAAHVRDPIANPRVKVHVVACIELQGGGLEPWGTKTGARGGKKRNTKKRRPYLAEEALIPSNQVVASLDILTMKTLCQHSLLQNFRGTSSQGGSFCGCKPEEVT